MISGYTAIFGLIALVLMVALYFSANYLAKTLMGKKHRKIYSVLIALFGYAILAAVFYLSIQSYL